MLQFDADAIKRRIRERLKSKTSFSDILLFGTNSRLIDSFSEELAFLALYDEYLTREMKWGLARNLTSLVGGSLIHNYKVKRKIGASGYVRVSLNETYIELYDWEDDLEYITVGEQVAYKNKFYQRLNHDLTSTSIGKKPDSQPLYWTRLNVAPALNITIPKYTLFSSSDYNFVSVEATSLTTGDDYIDVLCVEGDYTVYSTTALGNANEEFLITESNIENTYYSLAVNGVDWTETTNLLLQGNNDLYYEIENYIDMTGVYVKFGNNIHGKKLSAGDTVEFTYIKTNGALGNIQSRGLIDTIDSTLYYSNGTVADIFCYNTDLLAGGEEIEDIESVRINSPAVFQTGDRAVTIDDYKTIISNYANILFVNVWGAYETNIDNNNDVWTFIPGEENVVHVAAIKNDETELTDGEKTDIITLLNNSKPPTDIIQFEDIEIIKIIFEVVAYISDTSYTLDYVRNLISETLSDTYDLANMGFFKQIYFSDYQRLIDEVKGVEYHDTTVKFLKEFDLTTNAFSGSLNFTNITPYTVYLYDYNEVALTSTLIAQDDGSGNFTAILGTVVGQITYSSGLISVTNLGSIGVGHTIKVYYAIDSNNIILTKRYHLLDYCDESTYECNYILRK